MSLDRRSLLKLGGIAAAGATTRPIGSPSQDAMREAKADHTIRMSNGLAELGPEQIVSTAVYNGQFPGPLLRFREGQQVTIDLQNDTDHPELLHWHGQMIPADVDGAEEEASCVIPPRGSIREVFVPQPSGLRFYHTHVRAGADLDRGQYSGLVGPVYIEPKENPRHYDQEIFLVLKEFGPTFSRGGDMAQGFLAGAAIKALVAECGTSMQDPTGKA